MKDSAPNPPEAPATPIERPTWRFSGRRGTPVHMRERTPATLPPEIRQAVVKLAREQAGESASTAPKQSARAASSTLNLGGSAERSAPPVAGAPMPVERRTRSSEPEQPVTTTPLEAVPAPEPMDSATPPLVEAVADTPATDATPATEPDATTSEPALETTDEATTTSEPARATPAAKAGAAKPKLSEAERRKRAKAKAKARAKAAKGGEKPGAEDKSLKRRLFAKGRELDTTRDAVTIEPTPPSPPLEVVAEQAPEPQIELAAATTTPEPVAETKTPEPVAETKTPEPHVEPEPAPAAAEPVAVAEPEVQEAESEPEPERTPEPTPVAEAPASEPVSSESRESLEPAADLADEPQVAAIEDVDLGTTSTPVAPAASQDAPEPRLGTETAGQAAWELGRLPILIDRASKSRTPAPAPEPELVIPPATRIERMPAMEWKPMASTPKPKPVDETPEPRELPDEIAQLDAAWFASHVTRATRAGARGDDTGPSDPSDARQRIARRRRDLDELVASLDELRDRVTH
jgi:hypothetical protein